VHSGGISRRLGKMTARTLGLMAALTAATGILAFIVYRRKGKGDSKPLDDVSEVKKEASNIVTTSSAKETLNL